MKRIRTGWRLARESLAIVRADRSLAIFPLISTLCTAIALALTLTPGLIWSAAAEKDWIVVPFMVVGGYAVTFFVVYFNVALAAATRLSMDGRDTTSRDGLSVARQRRGLIARWALLQFTFGLLTRVVASLAGDSVGGRLLGLFSGLLAVAWSVATFFAVPVLAFEGIGPGAAMKRSAGLVRERWGEGLVGYTAINTAVLVIAALPLWFLFGLAEATIDVDRTAGAVMGVIAIVATIGAATIGSALGMVFRVELYRYATEGQASGRFAQRDIDGAFGQAPKTAG